MVKNIREGQALKNGDFRRIITLSDMTKGGGPAGTDPRGVGGTLLGGGSRGKTRGAKKIGVPKNSPFKNDPKKGRGSRRTPTPALGEGGVSTLKRSLDMP